jgi:hypothetical protein
MSKTGMTLVCVTVIAVALAVVARNWSCREKREPRPPRPNKVESFTVVSVPSGNTIEVKAGKKRTIIITLGLIAVPAECSEPSRANLAKMVGNTIEAEVPRRRLRGTEDEPAESEPLEARSPFTSPHILGESGLCLQLEQLKAGLAMPNTSDIPDEWMAATKYAQDNKLGMWATLPIPPEPEKSKWTSRLTWYAGAVFVFLFGWFVWDIYSEIRKAKEGVA